MGLLSKGTPLEWEEAEKYADLVRRQGILQFLNIYRQVKDRQRDSLAWGDEVEFMLLRFRHEQRECRLALRAADLLDQLQTDESNQELSGKAAETSWKPEYARYMLEATPGRPFGSSLKDLLCVEANMRLRRQTANDLLQPDEFLITLTSFPLLGCPKSSFLEPHYPPAGVASHSIFIPDEAIAPHARFPTLTRNIRKRRGNKVAINVPVYQDRKTQRPFVDQFPPAPFPEDGAQAAQTDHVYMDAMCFGMGCSCLQITFQACNINEARLLYDQLAVLTPIMLALTAAAPIHRGYLTDIDCRWNIISASVDDRTDEERGVKPLRSNRFRIPKSRYDSISMFLSEDPSMRPDVYNDIDLPFDESIFAQLLSSGVDPLLSKHISHLFIRDPLVIYKELLEQDIQTSSDHFENIQSTNWQTMRFKPPPPNSTIGWRVEFRSMEIQLTDFENAAFSVFIVLLSRAILSLGLNFYIPISKVDENMQLAQQRDAINRHSFHFRNSVFTCSQPLGCSPYPDHKVNLAGLRTEFGSPMPPPISVASGDGNGTSNAQTAECANGACDDGDGNGADDDAKYCDDSEWSRMTINEIINGCPRRNFPGLIPLIELYLGTMETDVETRHRLNRYLNLIKKRASGRLMTTARWIRQFVDRHPEYGHDSRIISSINYDLCLAASKITTGELWPEELLGRNK